MTITLTPEKINSQEIESILEICEQNLGSCYQCGNCSAGCPAADAMDILPNQVIRLLQLGQIEEIKKINTMFICASCITCTVRCPRSIDVAKVMEAVRQLVLRDKTCYVDINKISKDLFEKLPQLALVGNFRKLTD